MNFRESPKYAGNYLFYFASQFFGSCLTWIKKILDGSKYCSRFTCNPIFYPVACNATFNSCPCIPSRAFFENYPWGRDIFGGKSLGVGAKLTSAKKIMRELEIKNSSQKLANLFPRKLIPMY